MEVVLSILSKIEVEFDFSIQSLCLEFCNKLYIEVSEFRYGPFRVNFIISFQLLLGGKCIFCQIQFFTTVSIISTFNIYSIYIYICKRMKLKEA